MQIQPKRYLVLQVKLACLLTYCSHAYTVSVACVESARYGAPRKPSNGARDTAEELLCYSSYVLSIFDRLQPTPHTLYRMWRKFNVWSVRKLRYRQTGSFTSNVTTYRSGYAAENSIRGMCKERSLRKTLQCKWWYRQTGKFFLHIYFSYLLTDRIQITPFVMHAWKVQGMEIQENPKNGTRIQLTSYFYSPIKCPWLLTDRKQTYGICSACVGNANCGVWGKSVQWEPRYYRTCTFLSK